MLYMLLQSVAIHNNIVKINHNKMIKVRSKYLFHKGAKYGRCVCKAKGYDKELVGSISHHACCLWLMSLKDAHLIVPRPQIQLGKPLGTTKLIKDVDNVRSGVLIPDGDLI